MTTPLPNSLPGPNSTTERRFRVFRDYADDKGPRKTYTDLTLLGARHHTLIRYLARYLTEPGPHTLSWAENECAFSYLTGHGEVRIVPHYSGHDQHLGFCAVTAQGHTSWHRNAIAAEHWLTKQHHHAQQLADRATDHTQ